MPPSPHPSRRDLLEAASRLTVPGPGEIPYRTLGRTGEKVSLLGLGGFHAANPPDERETIGIVRAALDAGVNFLDNCWDYHGGASEVRMGKALGDGYRGRAFLMTKIDGRDRRTAERQIEESLRRLRTDCVDLLQLHEVIRPSDPERAFARGGAMEALLSARQAGKARFLGFTGHKSPAIHLAMLETARQHGVAFDAVQMPLNVLDAHYESFEQQVLPVLLERGIGVLGMKPLAEGHLPRSGAATAPECLAYAMSLPVSTVITGCDALSVLEQALGAARGFEPLAEEAIAALLTRTRTAAANGRHEPYKTTADYDATAMNPHWLGN